MDNWPLLPGSYTLGSMHSPTAIAILGRGRVDVPPELYCVKGRLRSGNIGIEIMILNLITNPRIRFLVVCGKEDGHLPGDALTCLFKNGVDDGMRIIGTRAQMAFLPDIDRDSIERLREQVTLIDLVHPRESDGIIDWKDPQYPFEKGRRGQLIEVLEDVCERDPGPLTGKITVEVPSGLMNARDIGETLRRHTDRISNIMLRMPSEKLSTDASTVIVSGEFGVVLDPVDGSLTTVPTIDFYERMREYLMGG